MHGENDVMKYLRAFKRVSTAVALCPVMLGLLLVQATIGGPLFEDYETIPKLFLKAVRKAFGYKVEFNAAAAPKAPKDKQVWYVINHIAVADALVAGSKLKGVFVAKGEILTWPIISSIARLGSVIGLRREKDFNAEARGMIIKNFNEGNNTIMFPEGTTTDGKKLALFHAGLFTILYGDKGVDEENKEVKLEKEVIIQPVALRVKEVGGKNALGSDELRNIYTMPGDSLKEAWKQLCAGGITLEMTLTKPLDPKNFPDAKALINQAAKDIAAIVSPGQTTFERAKIPGQPEKKAPDTAAPSAPPKPAAP